MRKVCKRAIALGLSAALLTGMMSGLSLAGTVRAEETKQNMRIEQSLPDDIRAKLDAYDVVWTSPSNDSRGSMPIGNGDISANVWVEPDGNLYFYIGKSDSWSEAARLLKVGKVKVSVSPNPFDGKSDFVQMLDLENGAILVRAGSEGKEVTLKIWADANHPAIRVEAVGDQNFDIKVSRDHWRDEVSDVPGNNDGSGNYREFQNTHLRAPAESADVVTDEEDAVEWYHRNEESPYQTFLDNQNVGDLAGEDPYLNRTFGAKIQGEGFQKTDKNTLSGTGKNTYQFSVYAHTDVTDTVEEWDAGLEEKILADEKNIGTAYEEHQEWWDSFWNRSWIFVSGDDQAETVTRGYLLQRYMEAIQGRGAYPIKFNGGTLTLDWNGKDADSRNWGAPYWFQNTRLLYWNMLASGDFEMMQPWFNMYKDALELQKGITKKYYGHEGAFFPETMNFFGAYVMSDFLDGKTENKGTETNNPYVRYYWQCGLELSKMMLEYYDYTKDEVFLQETAIPFAEEVVKFYDQHYKRENGVLKIDPAHVLETYWDNVVNPVEVVTGLHTVVDQLLALSDNQITAEQRSEWSRLKGELPAVPLGTSGDKTFVKPAEQYSPNRKNSENPELYPVFPYKMYGVGKDNLEIGINTFDRRQVRDEYCWHQNGIQAAYLGLEKDAKRAVISHFSNKQSDVRFPAFWAKANDWVPDFDNGGSAMSALQAMVMQCNGKEIQVLPAWPSEWSVDAKLNALDNTAVRIQYQAGKDVKVVTNPESRMEDVIINTPEVPELPAEDPVAWWTFDEGEGTAVSDKSGNEHFGTVIPGNGTVQWVDGVNGKALEIKNGAKVMFDDSTLEAEDSLTLSMWVKTDTTREGYLFSGWYNAGPMTQFTFNVGDGGYHINGFTAGTGRIHSKTVVNDNEWHHVVWRYEQNKTFKIYIDGNEEASVNCPAKDFSKWVWVLGAESPDGAASFSGTFDDVRVYERALSAMEIKGLTKPADYAKVDAAIAEADKLVKDLYTAESWGNLQKAVDAVVRDMTAENQEKVDVFAAAINEAIENLVQAEKKEFTITVNGESKTYTYNEAVTIEAPAAAEGMEFAGWEVDGTIISYKETYKFYVSKDMTFTATYAETVAKEAKAMLSNVFVTKRPADGKSDVKFVGELVVPEGYEIVNAGLIWSSKDTELILNKDTEPELNPELRPTFISKISDTNQFSVTIKGMPQGKFIRGRIFATITNGTETKVIYSGEKKVFAVK